MDAEQSKVCVIDAWNTFGTCDQTAIAACFSDDAEWLAPAGNATATALRMSHHIVGPKQLASFIAEDFRKLLRDAQVELLRIIAAPDCVVIEERTRATLPDGRPYENEYCLVFELRDGRIHRVREYMDTLRAQQQVFGSPV